ncbi:MAG: preprotein translocase subunit YajC [Oscillospiraceae bacterium]|nr:preprotein translocase subunit YajC [Oscillospiraceae bacterium]MBQ6849726.1 preprotein translocase subunit YajC [Oscillospiraceae bacterium]
MLEAAATDSLIAVLMSNTMPFIIVLGVMYFMLISPQKKREKRLQELRNTLEIGDGVVTAGGIVGRVISIKEDTVVIESASSKIRVKRWAISDVEKLDA